jgi:hypothetical protein
LFVLAYRLHEMRKKGTYRFVLVKARVVLYFKGAGRERRGFVAGCAIRSATASAVVAVEDVLAEV